METFSMIQPYKNMEILERVIPLFFIFIQIQYIPISTGEQLYTIIKHKNISLENSVRDFDARSQIECLLRCQRISEKIGFYGDDGQCFCISRVVYNDNGDMISGNMYSEVKIEVKSQEDTKQVIQPIPPMFYVFTGQLKIWVLDDYGEVYEPYGALSVDIGDELSGIQLWKLSSSSGFTVPNNDVFTARFSYHFNASREFVENGFIVLLGQVREKDGANSESVGDFDGETISVKSIFKKEFTTKTYPSKKGVDKAYVKIDMKVEESSTTT